MPTQCNQTPEAKRFEDIFYRTSVCREVTNVSRLAIVGEVKHVIPTRDLVWMLDQTPSVR